MTDRYNKKTQSGAGTLEGNWLEERVLREKTGFGRSATANHVPKKDGEPLRLRPGDQTTTRLLGDLWEEPLAATNHNYGAATNAADSLRKVGKREELLTRQLLNEVLQSQEEAKQAEEAQRNARYLDTTTRTTFTGHQPTEPVGKRVMKTQDGRPAEAKDEDFLVEHGLREPKPRRPLEKLDAEVRAATKPITLYSETLDTGHFPISVPKGPNPFARTAGFTQPLGATRAAAHFPGNITG